MSDGLISLLKLQTVRQRKKFIHNLKKNKMTSIYKAKKYKGIYYVNGKCISLSDYQINKYNDFNNHEIKSFEDYLKAQNLI